MDIFNNLGLGFSVAGSLVNLLYCFAGVMLGTIIGILPGIGPVATVAMLLPLTYGLEPTTSLIMLAGIYYGSQYGGSTTAILINLPGEASSAVTSIDGYKMALKGLAGKALAVAALSSFFAGSVSTLLIAAIAGPLAALALSFGSAEYFSLMVVGLVSSIALASGSILKAIAMIALGLLLGLTGSDLYTGAARFTFGQVELLDGLDFVAIAVGLFGVSEILRNLETSGVGRSVIGRVKGLWPTRGDFSRMLGPSVRGTAIGSMLGILPGGGALLSSFVAYNVEKNISKNSAEFGHGALEGVAAPEAANNAGAQTSFIPMLSLGIPSNAVMALMIGAMIIQGIVPGPGVIQKNPELFWGLIASMWIGNVMLVILNLPLVGLWVRLMRVPYWILFPSIVAFCCIGTYSIASSSISVYLIAISGVVGYFLIKIECEPAPFVLGFILGPLLEEYLRRTMILSGGDFWIFLQRPLSAFLLLVAAIVLFFVSRPYVARRRKGIFVDEQ